ncbi:MAG: NUDIX domain-containing protein [Proteobacteria bacterium]|nr:NUDIX domain-containing protein [Pseudomonadota bacterium]NIS71685.1 NUDIX domain-containing protein [Pseudomonadota bacterium]
MKQRHCFFCQRELVEDIAFCEICGNFFCTACLAEISQREYDSAYPVGVCTGCRELQSKKSKTILCPRCGFSIKEYRSPLTTVDIIIECPTGREAEGLALIMRDREPRMWALPGGFCEYGESLEDAAVREAKEETGLDVELIKQLHTYSDPDRDPRHHSITTVFIAKGMGVPKAGDDAREVRVFSEADIPEMLAFDHKRILDDYFVSKKTGTKPGPRGIRPKRGPG